MVAHASFGPMLRRWRAARGVSQERLASAAEVSSRHLSFLETGRAAPSREMVLVLASALDLPLRERNVMLGAAGFAAVYRESSYESAALAGVRRALSHLLRVTEPYAAIVVDRLWDLRETNQGALSLFGWLTDGAPLSSPNVFVTVFDPEGLRPLIANWREVAGQLMVRLHHEIAEDPDDAGRRALRDKVLAFPEVPDAFHVASAGDPIEPYVPVHFRKGDVTLRYFTTITTLGTPLDVTAQELRIESYFPVDDATERFTRDLVQKSG